MPSLPPTTVRLLVICSQKETHPQTVTKVTNEEAPALRATTGEEPNSEHQVFVFALITIALVGMWLLTFAVLAFGRTGISLGNICGQAAWGAVDIAVIAINDEHAPQATERNTIIKRALCWLAIGILVCLLESLMWTSYDQKKYEESEWQPESLLYDFAWKFGCLFFLPVCAMMRAHRDRRPTVAVWYALAISFAWLTVDLFGWCSPYPQISTLTYALYLLVATVGIYICILVMHIDKKKSRAE